jgi:hypothetical protein
VTESKERIQNSTAREIAAAWERRFLEAVAREPAAQRAWKKLKGAGLSIISTQLLWEYANAADLVSGVRQDIRRMDHNLKVLKRADQVARKRAADPRRKMFEQRHQDAVGLTAQTSWPFRNPNVPTVADAALAYPLIGNLPANDAANPKDGDALRRWGGKIILAILRTGARAHGVRLGSKALAALACCAQQDPDRIVDERVLRRFFHETPIHGAEPAYLHLFNTLLPRFSPR